MVVGIILHKRAIREVHVAIREELSVQRTTLHVDGSSMLETMVVLVPEIESNVLERSTFGNISNVSTASMFKHHTIHSTLNGNVGNVLWKIWHCVRTSSGDADSTSRRCRTNSRCQLILGSYIHCSLCGRDACHY